MSDNDNKKFRATTPTRRFFKLAGMTAGIATNMAKNQVLEQAGVSVLAQANQLPQLALKLLG